MRVKNTGARSGSYVALAFMSPPNATTTSGGGGDTSYMTIAPKKVLFGFGRVTLAPGQSQVIDFLLQLNAAAASAPETSDAKASSRKRFNGNGGETLLDWSSASVDSAGQQVVLPGLYKIQVTDAEPQYFEARGEPVTVGSQF